MDDKYCVPISIGKDNSDTICERVKYIIDGVRFSQRLTRSDMFVLDFCEQRMLWASEKIIHISQNKYRKRDCQNPLWALASDEVFQKLTVMSRELCKAVGEHFTQGEDGLVCTMDFPVSTGNRTIYITQKSTITITEDDTVKTEYAEGVRIISINTVQMSITDKMECTLIFPNGDISLYDMENECFLPPRNYIALTGREREVLIRAKSAHSCEELAEEMNISLNTLKKHRQSIYKKLNAHSFQQAIVYAMKYNQI